MFGEKKALLKKKLGMPAVKLLAFNKAIELLKGEDKISCRDVFYDKDKILHSASSAMIICEGKTTKKRLSILVNRYTGVVSVMNRLHK